MRIWKFIKSLFSRSRYGAVVNSSPALFETSLASAIGTSDTSLTLVTGKTRDGTSLSGYVCLTIDSGLPTTEYVCGSASGATVTGLTRGIGSDGFTSFPALKFSHRYGADVKITDFPYLQQHANFLNGVSTLPNPLVYVSGTAGFITASAQLASKGYVDSVAIAGAPDSSTTVKGIGKVSYTPVSAINPIFVGDNDPRVPTTAQVGYIPTSDQKAALAGTSGTPSSTNKYVTDADTTGTGSIIRSSALVVPYIASSLTAQETIVANAAVALGYYQSDGGVQLDTKTGDVGNAASVNTSITIGNNTNRYLIVCLYTENSTIYGNETFTFGGVAMTQLYAQKVTNGGEFWVFEVIAPPTGSSTLAMSFANGSSTHFAWSLHSYYNAKQTSQPDVSSITGVAKTKSSTSVVAGDLVFGAIAVTCTTGGITSFTGLNNNTIIEINATNLLALYAGDDGQAINAGITQTIIGTQSGGTGTIGNGTCIILISPVTVPTFGVVNASSASAYTIPASSSYRATGFIGFAVAGSTQGNPITVVTQGILSGFTGLTPSQRYYLNDTNGTIGLSVGTVTQKAGIAISATQLLITNEW